MSWDLRCVDIQKWFPLIFNFSCYRILSKPQFYRVKNLVNCIFSSHKYKIKLSESNVSMWIHTYREENICTRRKKLIKGLLECVEGYFYKTAEKCYTVNMPQIQVLEINCQCYIVLRVRAFRRWLNKERKMLMNETSKSVQGLKRTNNVSFASSVICGGGHNVYLLWEREPATTLEIE